MTNPEFGPITESQYERMQGEAAVARLGAALDPVVHEIVDLAHNAVFSDVDRYVPEDMMEELYVAVDAARGYPVQGKTREYNKYLVTVDGVAMLGTLPYRRHYNYGFEGVLGGIGRVVMDREESAFEQLCLIINPLNMLRDAALSRRYIDQDRLAWLKHPFGADQYPDKPVHLPLSVIKEGSIELLDYWKVS